MQTIANETIVFIIICTLLIAGLVGFSFAILFFYQKKQVAFLQNLEALKLDHEKNLLKTQLEIQEQTFQNISREIHDNIGLSLTLAKLNLNTLEWNNLEKSKELITSSVDLISKSIYDLSDISKSLDSEALSQQGWLNALQLEVNKIKKLNRFNIGFEVTGTPVFFDSQKELILFRIVQEALNNIIKHAEATQIQMGVIFGEAWVQLKIADNGKGFCFNETHKNCKENMNAGLVNMKTRAQLINGEFNLHSVLGEGTTISITAPIEA